MNNILTRIKARVKGVVSTLSRKGRRHSLVGGASKWKMKREFQLRFLKNVGLKPTNTFLDIGCGTLRGGIPVIKYLDNNRYFGIDVRESVIEEAKLEVVESMLEEKEPTLMSLKDLKSARLANKFDSIWAFSVLIHMPDDVLDDCFAFVAEHLNKDGVFYANVNVNLGEMNQLGNWNEFPVMAHEFLFYENLAKSHGLKVHDLGDLKVLGHHSGVLMEDRQRMLKIWKYESS